MITQLQKEQSIQPISSRIQEIDRELDSLSFNNNELNYLDQIKIQDLHRQIKKIYLKYSPKKLQQKIKFLQNEIKDLLNKDELDIQAYSLLDYALKEELKLVKKPVMMSTLDDARVNAFQERIDKIYSYREPSDNELLKIERLIEEKEELLSLI